MPVKRESNDTMGRKGPLIDKPEEYCAEKARAKYVSKRFSLASGQVLWNGHPSGSGP
jgi:hypothetical protein